MADLHRFASPARFRRLSAAVLPWAAAVAALAFAAGLYAALFASPADYRQGETVRIMYVHVPAAWMALLVYTLIAAASAAALIWKHPLAHVAARAAAPVGAVFTVLCLVTGALWGRPIWGAWWVWDARLTSVLVLLFLYLGHMALLHAFDDPGRGDRAAAVLALVGVVNVPVIKFSVDWWNTLHQPASVSRLDAPAIDPAMLVPLALMATAFMAYFVTVLLLRMRAELAARKVRVLRLGRVRTAARAAPAAG